MFPKTGDYNLWTLTVDAVRLQVLGLCYNEQYIDVPKGKKQWKVRICSSERLKVGSPI